MRKQRVVKSVGCLILALLMVISCMTPVQASSKGKISKSSETIYVGQNTTLKVTGASGKVTWSTSNKKVATVSKSGVVTGKKAGKATITAKAGSKKFTCKVTVKKLSSKYATVNGKLVKVGKDVTISWTIKSPKPVQNISVKYYYDYKNLEIDGVIDDFYSPWVINEEIPEYNEDGKTCHLMHLVGVDPKDPYSMAALPCKSGVNFGNMKLKVKKSGNYTFKSDYYAILDSQGNDVKGAKITEKVK